MATIFDNSLSSNILKRRIEWPTLAVAAIIYSIFGLLTWFYDALPWWLVLPIGGYLVAWHGSLQHEVVHGHPTPWRWFNELLVFPSLWLWQPYAVYRESHLTHHRDEHLTDPRHDPESFYVTPETWARMGPLRRGRNMDRRRSFEGDSNCDKVERSRSTFSANAVRLSPERSMTSLRRSRKTSTVFLRSMFPPHVRT